MSDRVFKIGFTGTQKGMTVAQRHTLRTRLAMMFVEEARHGDCVGADAEFHDACVYHKVPRIWIHPPLNPVKQAFCETKDWGASVVNVVPPRPYLARNRDIVDGGDILIATPSGYEEELRSGTWSTVRYARKQNKRIYIIQPDGAIVVEGEVPFIRP